MTDKARKRRETFKAEGLHILLEEVEANKGLLFDGSKVPIPTSKIRRSGGKKQRE